MLTDADLRSAKPREKAYRLSDARGLHLLVKPTGARLWRFRYRFRGVPNMLSFGAYPEISLKEARDDRDEARRMLNRGIDPSAHRKAEKLASGETFEAIAREWLAVHHREVDAGTYRHTKDRLEQFVFPKIGAKGVSQIGAQDLLTALKPLEARGVLEQMKRTRNAISRVLRYAMATGRAQYDASAGLADALALPEVNHFAAIIEPTQIGELLRAIDGYQGQPAVVYALRLAPLVFVRPGELRGAQWSEFALDGKHPEWRIAAERMKMRELHIVPLAKQAIAILRELQANTGRGTYLFPSLRTNARPISDVALLAALRRLGYSGEEMTVHGFRSMASTLLNEQGFAPDVIELQLAHSERNKVRAAYNRAQRLEERRKMMQSWADYLDGLRAGDNMVAIGRAKT